MLTSFNFTTHLQDFLQIGIIATVISSLTHKETKLATNLSPNKNVNDAISNVESKQLCIFEFGIQDFFFFALEELPELSFSLRIIIKHFCDK